MMATQRGTCLQGFAFNFGKEGRRKEYEIHFIQFDLISDSVFQHGPGWIKFDLLIRSHPVAAIQH
jgi:hypothetical protein